MSSAPSQNLLQLTKPAAWEKPARALKVALVNMPWGQPNRPSIQCGLLKSVLVKAGHDVVVHYPNLELCHELGPNVYGAIEQADSERIYLVGEWLFGPAAFATVEDESKYFGEFPELLEKFAKIGMTEADVVNLRRTVLPSWITRLAARPEWGEYDIVGFSSTFFQNVASLALAQRLKQHHPKLVTVFGGANFDGDMGPEWVKAMPHIDYAVVGEGDLALPRLAAAISRGDSASDVPGVCSRDKDGTIRTTEPEPPFAHMDDLPLPDHSDYFSTLRLLGQDETLGERSITLPVEFSRGCWWGEKHHCTFCGLNALGMQYRAKSPEVALTELEQLLEKHRVLNVFAVDNIIDMKYLGTLCEDLRARKWDAEIFFEVKANLSRDQIALMAGAGIRWIQPGIESFSSHVLKLMRKGSSTLINVRLLKWARYYGINASYYLLSGFPGETDGDYEQQAKVVPLISHLQPPGGPSPVNTIWLERFSPYFTDPSFPIRDVTPRAAYKHVYPVGTVDLSSVAYYFDYSADAVASPTAVGMLADAINGWRERWHSSARPELTYRRGPGWLDFEDSRFTSQPRRETLSGWQARAYDLCADAARTAKKIHETLQRESFDVTATDVDNFFVHVSDAGLVLQEEEKYLALAIPFGKRLT